ncbi:MAG: CvpA family protein [Rickettsiaceae bacterium]|nr:CvpA family protein [Rickettsiaceae bacterium]
MGAIRGASVTLLNLCRFICTILLTFTLSPMAKEIIQEHVHSEVMIEISSIITSYILSYFGLGFVSKRLKEFIIGKPGILDIAFGLWIGAFRGAMICFCIFAILGSFFSSSYTGAKNIWQVLNHINEKEYPNWLKKSSLYGILQYSLKSSTDFAQGSCIETTLTNIKLPAKSTQDKEESDDKNKKDGEKKEDSDLLKDAFEMKKLMPGGSDVIIESIQKELNMQQGKKEDEKKD